MNFSAHNRSRAFTLIELLLVITIIAIPAVLPAVLLPVTKVEISLNYL